MRTQTAWKGHCHLMLVSPRDIIKLVLQKLEKLRTELSHCLRRECSCWVKPHHWDDAGVEHADRRPQKGAGLSPSPAVQCPSSNLSAEPCTDPEMWLAQPHPCLTELMEGQLWRRDNNLINCHSLPLRPLGLCRPALYRFEMPSDNKTTLCVCSSPQNEETPSQLTLCPSLRDGDRARKKGSLWEQ